jgi:tellurite resistance protein TehA-like permease
MVENQIVDQSRILTAAPPAAGAIVLGTGNVSVALASARSHTLSVILLTIAATIWLGLGLLLAHRAIRDLPGVRRQARLPAALTSVAATAVLGARATGLGWSGVAGALLALATLLWLILLAPVLSRPRAKAGGVAFMPTVSTQSLAILAAQLAVRTHAVWLLYTSLALLALGLGLYGLVLTRFDFRQLLVGRGDHWVSGGALAISALAAARLTLGARELHHLSGAAGSLHTLTLALWILSAVWLPPLIVSEAIRPRLSYDLRRWATVFPMGMYAACSFDAGRAAAVSGLTDFGHVWAWIAFALWVIVFVAMLGRASSLWS